MPNWSGGILTTRGKNLQAKVDAGQTTLTFTKMKIGSGILPNGQSLESLTELITPKQNIPISGIAVNGNITTLTAVITNAGVAAGYQVRELGVYATDPTLGEILYSVTVDSAPDYLPEEGGAVAVSQEFNYHIAVSNAANVTATLSTSGLVTVGMLQQHNHDGTGSNGPKLGSNALLDGAVTDLAIGNRTIVDTTVAAAGGGTITNLISKIGYMLKSFSGKPNWYTVPSINLETVYNLFNASTGHKHTGGAGDAPKIAATGLADGAATDTIIGSRTATDATAPTSLTGGLTALLSGAFYMVKAITGKSNGYTAPAITLEATKAHVDATSAHGATSANTASAIVQRDASGNFIANTITAALNGLASTATKLATARTIAISGKVTGTATGFDGSGNIVIPVTAVTADSCTGNSATATSAAKLTTARIVTLTGDVTGSGSFDGSSNLSISTTNTAAMPVGFTFPLLANSPLPGSLALQGALVSRTAYPDLWAWVQANAPLITESAWQAQAVAQTSVGAYSSGDGSTTFRLPKIVDFVRGSDVGRTPGTFQSDAFQGHGHKVYMVTTGNAVGSGSTPVPNGDTAGVRDGAPIRMGITSDVYAMEEIDNGYGTPRIDTETRSKSISMLWCVKAFGAAVNQGTVDITALATQLNLLDTRITGLITSTKAAETYVRYYHMDNTIEQQGHVASVNLANGLYTVTFPVQFPTKVRRIQMQCGKVNPSNGVTQPEITAFTLTGFTFRHQDADSYLQEYWWKAEGE